MKLIQYIKQTITPKNDGVRQLLVLAGFVLVFLSACEKNDYLDIDAGDRPVLSAKVKFINARSSAVPINFWDFTRQVTTTPLAKNTSTAGYLDTQYGKVQFNITEGTSTTYKASYIFGGSATFQQETDKTSFSAPNGPIASFYHTIIAASKLKPSKINPGNTDTLVLVYDDLEAPAAGKAKVRFANFYTGNLKFNLAADGDAIFSNVGYGTFAGQVAIPYDANGKGPATIEGLSWKSFAPFKEVTIGANTNFQVRNAADNSVFATPNNALADIKLEAGKIYTILLTGTPGDASSISTKIIEHTK